MINDSDANTDETKLHFLKALITDRDFINELIDAAGDTNPEAEFKRILKDNGFSTSLCSEIAEFENNRFKHWHLNLENLASSDIHKFIPQGMIGYY